MTTLGAALALIVGFVMGLLGGGGAVLALPILIYALRVPVKSAIAMSLAVISVAAFIGFLAHLAQGTVKVRVALVFGPFAVVAAYAGARIAQYVPAESQLILFAFVGLAGSVLMFRGTFRKSESSESIEYTFRPTARTVALFAAYGIVVGLLTGLIGVGGGFLIVPALVLGARLPMRLAVGTSLPVITVNTLSGFLGYVGTVAIDWELVAWFTGFAAVGTVIGTVTSKRVPQRHLRQVFGVLLVGVSLYVLYRR